MDGPWERMKFRTGTRSAIPTRSAPRDREKSFNSFVRALALVGISSPSCISPCSHGVEIIFLILYFPSWKKGFGPFLNLYSANSPAKKSRNFLPGAEGLITNSLFQFIAICDNFSLG
jgi:hypothetical protein